MKLAHLNHWHSDNEMFMQLTNRVMHIAHVNHPVQMIVAGREHL